MPPSEKLKERYKYNKKPQLIMNKTTIFSITTFAYSLLVLLMIGTFFIDPLFNFMRAWFPYSTELNIYSVLIAIVADIISLITAIIQ